MHYMVLGPLEVRTRTGEIVSIRRGRPRALLHLLLMNRRVVVPVDVVADRLWDDDVPRDSSNAVHQLVSYVRRTLGPEGKHQLVTSPVGYLLDVAEDDVDAGQFDRLFQQAIGEMVPGSMATARTALAAAEEATRLWRGDPYLESQGHEWASGDINRLKESWLQLQETRLEAMLALGRHREVVLEAQSLAAAHPLREQFHAQRALALYRSDRQGEALDALRRVRGVLADELGLDPGTHLQLLEQQILRQDPQLTWQADDTVTVARPPANGPAPAPEDPAEQTGANSPTPNKPPRAPRLHGRDDDYASVSALLEAGALVTVTGPAGIGKSALVRSLARTGVPGPVWYVDLADVDSHHLTPTAIARQTGYSGQLPPDPISILADGFRGLGGLLVLDTCEQLLPTVALTAQVIRDSAPDLTVLATSRRPLELADEVVYRLKPLSTPVDLDALSLDELQAIPSVALFMERATRVRNDFTLDETTARDVAEIARSMEGLPLGLELAASNADALDARGIRDRLQLLVSTDAESSHSNDRSTLSVALDSSYVLLTAEEKRVLGPLSVFRGSFDLEAVKAVVAPEVGDPYPTLASLVRQSMVSFEGHRAYRLLRPIRSYVAAKAAAEPDHDDVRDRHARYVASTADEASRELRTTDTALERLHGLLPDARASMEWLLSGGRLDDAADIAVAYTWHWAINGLAAEGISWLTAVASEIERRREQLPVTPEREAAVLRSLGLLSNPLGAVRQAADYCRRALELSRARDDLGSTAALLTLGIAEWALGHLAAAAAAHDEALELASRTGDRWHRLAALTLRARTALDAGEADAAERIEAAITAGQAENEGQLLSISMTLLARHQLGSGQADAASLAADLASKQAQQIGYREGELGALNLRGRALLAQGDLDGAQDCFMRALRSALAIGHRAAVCETLESLALSAARGGRHDEAYLLLQASGRERESLGLQVPAYDAEVIAAAKEASAEALGSTTSILDARARLLRFETLVEELLSDNRVATHLT